MTEITLDRVLGALIMAPPFREVYNWDYHYYRARSGAEIDLVLSGEFGLLPIEIKYDYESIQIKGFFHLSFRNREKSESVDCNSHPCAMARAAK